MERDIDGRATIEPDTKNWTWVLERACPDCGFDASTLQVTATGATVRALVDTWSSVLERPTVRQRPAPAVWSPLEYACHVRDVFDLFDRRLALMLDEEDPQFENWDQDRTAVDADYGGQCPDAVRTELAEAGRRLAHRFDSVRTDQWECRGRRSDGAVFTVDSFARYFLHDPVHHLWDVEER